MNFEDAIVVTLVAALAVSCVDTPSEPTDDSVPLLADVTLVTGTSAGPAVELAASDFALAVQRISGGEIDVVETIGDATTRGVITVSLSEELDEQQYTIRYGEIGERRGLEIESGSDVASMYALYDVLGEMGVRYFHPESSFHPTDEDARLPADYEGDVVTPRFLWRGFHEHTQHPIPTSDFYLRPEPEHRPYVSNYLQWLARNRQNVASFHMLKTVELDAWEPYVGDIVDEAHAYGIDIGLVASFADEQQNNFKILEEAGVEEERRQIEAALSRFVDIGFDFVTFPIGSSEFTKPEDEAVVRRLDIAAEVARELDPQPALYSWVHISCELLADDGSIFWHLPGDADEDVGAWVHTVMFHDLEHPAPVYDCEDFVHQREFIDREVGERELVYFPETAWWLGFDNNMPVALPITGWTRAHDINEVLEGRDVRGHVTFTSGREWGYWQYDHFLTRATWEHGLTWDDYLAWIQPLFGEQGEALVTALRDFTDRQVQDFFETNPLIYFYVAGELRQDEIGAQAGILARRPKIPYRDVIRYDDETFAEWERTDLELLREMRGAYAGILETVEAPAVPGGGDLTEILAFETYSVLDLFVKRVEHAIALYEGVSIVREWELAKADGAERGGERHADLLEAANEKLDEARALSEAARTIIHHNEAFYRYPAEFLYEEKPESLTSYPFGYLEQTHTAHFWTRRDDQLAELIDERFFERPDEWENEPAEVFFAEKEDMTLHQPSNSLAQEAIVGFVPRMFVGLDAEGQLVVGQDYNENFIADRGTEITVPLAEVEASLREGTADLYTFVVRNSVGEELGAGLSVFDPTFRLHGATLERLELEGEVSKANLVTLLVDVGGIDAAGAERLVGAVFGYGADEEVPALLPFAVELALRPVSE